MDIVTFLRKHIAQDKKEAELAISGQADKGWEARFVPDFRNYVINPHVGVVHEGLQAHHVETWDPWRVIDECEAKEKILRFHEQWPVLVETPPRMEQVEGDDISSMAFRMSRDISWLTTQKYLEVFGERPPTDPIVRAMAHPYRHDPDFNPEWSIA